MKQLLSLALGLLYCIVINARPLPFPSGMPPAVVTTSAVNASMADDILKYVNEYRRKRRLPPMTMNAAISAEAQKHSENMAKRRTAFGHNGFKGRMKRIVPQIHGNGSVAENVAYGSTSAKQVVENWLHSPMHRENIEGRFNLTGIGIAADKNGRLYFTQIFAAN